LRWTRFAQQADAAAAFPALTTLDHEYIIEVEGREVLHARCPVRRGVRNQILATQWERARIPLSVFPCLGADVGMRISCCAAAVHGIPAMRADLRFRVHLPRTAPLPLPVPEQLSWQALLLLRERLDNAGSWAAIRVPKVLIEYRDAHEQMLDIDNLVGSKYQLEYRVYKKGQHFNSKQNDELLLRTGEDWRPCPDLKLLRDQNLAPVYIFGVPDEPLPGEDEVHVCVRLCGNLNGQHFGFASQPMAVTPPSPPAAPVPQISWKTARACVLYPSSFKSISRGAAHSSM
jgi:hypothetical protein